MTLSMADIVAAAQAEGIGGRLPDGEYLLSIKQVKAGMTSGGDPQISLQWQVVQGPAGGTSWQNQTLKRDNPQNQAIFVRLVGDLGVTPEALVQVNPDTSTLDGLAAYIGQINPGVIYAVRVENKVNGQYRNTNFYINQRGVQAGAVAPVAAAAPQPVVAVAPAPVPQPVAQPVVVQPVIAQPVPAPVAVPVQQVVQQPVVQPAVYAEQPAVVPQPVAVAPQPVVAVAAPVQQVIIDPQTGLPARPGGGI